MPATEQTWRDSRLMHVIFGISGLAMLGATIWMLAADHDREWKDYQREFRKVEAWTTQSRLDAEKTDAFEAKRAELVAALEKARSTPPDGGLITQFAAIIREHEGPEASIAAVTDAESYLRENPSRESRDALIDALNKTVREARFQEDELSSKLKFRRADLDVARSSYDLGVGKGFSVERLAKLQQEVDAAKVEVAELNGKVEDAKTYRKALEAVVVEIRAEESAAVKALDEHLAEEERLAGAYTAQTDRWRTLLELPILDAFNSPLKIKQLWLPKLTLNNNFRDVARFDRCTTCHLGIETTAPGSAVEPGFRSQDVLSTELATPAAKPELRKTADEKTLPPSLREMYGLTLADSGLLREGDVTIEVVDPRTPAAKARLQPGDVLLEIGGVKITSRPRALTYLTESVEWGKPLKLVVRRGVPQPYSSHPRLDLYVGSLSPHKAQEIGCTICHDGQGSATSFQWASHMPSTHGEAEAWRTKHGWFDNHHWIFPMRPSRFIESSCLKCHHEVTELESSERYPEPPAPKLLRGYDLVRQYGCFGCHEMNGFDGPDKRIGPDLRAEPNYAFAASQLLNDANIQNEHRTQERTLAEQVVADPTNAAARRQLVQLIESDTPTAEKPALSLESRKLASLLADVEMAGTYRKVGPSLRHLGDKVDLKWLYNWVREPKDFRPTTRMPQFFGLWGHLLPEPKLDAGGRPIKDDDHLVMTESKGRAESEKFEPIEIRAISEYLLANSQPFKYAGKPEGVTEKPSAERGKSQFQLRGCLACHQHNEFPDAKQTQGPDLSRIGAKLIVDKNTGLNGQAWLYSWVRQPNRYHSRTVMPNVFLEPIEEKDKEGNVTAVTDPAADITAYLLGSQQGWQPKPVPELESDKAALAALDELALMHLSQAYSKKRAEKYLQDGIPEIERANLKGDEVALVGQFKDDATRRKHKLQYVGRRSISKYGCSGCHDIPGFENAKPIGTGLADWGRKDPSKLAFEQISGFIGRTRGHAGHGDSTHYEYPKIQDLPVDEGYFLEKLQHHGREGFLWQKLGEPRSYDYKKTENKTYNERLRMPKFPFKPDEIEAVMTFVLGLVAEPPVSQYVHQPDPRQKAIVEGRQMLDRFNCAGCHVLEMEKWAFDFDPNYKEFANEKKFPADKEYELFRPNVTSKEALQSRQTDRRGLGHAEITATLGVNEQGEVQELEDEEDPTLILQFFTLWRNAVINGQPWLAGDQVPISRPWITDVHPQVGGDLARLLHPVVLAAQRQVNPNAKFGDAWGWLPPPLEGEGRKVQTDWLHDFLLDPYAIRPAVVLRMPKFNMSSAEASKLANYFAAVEGEDYPYEFDRRTRDSHLAAADSRFPGRLEDALKIVTNGNFCVKCHKLGDYTPQGSVREMAPQLGQVARRLRPEFLQAWLANPRRLLPYTGMPVNFALDKTLDPKVILGDKGPLITEGHSPDQMEAVVDLLLNYDRYVKEQYSIKPLIQAPTMPPAASGE